SIREDAPLRAVGLEHYDASVIKSSINLSIRIDCNVLGFVSVSERKFLHGREAIVLLILSCQRWRDWRSPGTWIDRYRREEKIRKCGNEDHRNTESNAFFEGH